MSEISHTTSGSFLNKISIFLVSNGWNRIAFGLRRVFREIAQTWCRDQVEEKKLNAGLEYQWLGDKIRQKKSPEPQTVEGDNINRRSFVRHYIREWIEWIEREKHPSPCQPVERFFCPAFLLKLSPAPVRFLFPECLNRRRNSTGRGFQSSV